MNDINPYYTFKVHLRLILNWMGFFENNKLIEYPINNNQLIDNLFWTKCIIACAEIEMLSFYGCLDSKL